MFRRVFIFCSCLFILGGCASNDDPMPEIVYDSGSKPVLIPPKVVTPKQSRANAYRNVPRSWLPPSQLEKKWVAVMVHHSAPEYGNAAIIDKWHRERNHWEGVGYDFVIGNGTDSGDGQVEVTFRWRKQIPGAHCGGTPFDAHNPPINSRSTNQRHLVFQRGRSCSIILLAYKPGDTFAALYAASAEDSTLYLSVAEYPPAC